MKMADRVELPEKLSALITQRYNVLEDTIRTAKLALNIPEDWVLSPDGGSFIAPMQARGNGSAPIVQPAGSEELSQ